MFPFEHVITIDKGHRQPVYRQICLSISNAIVKGTLQAGTQLPGSRELAKMLGVHRKTVIAAYDELQAQDWIVIEPRKHVSVSGRIPTLKPRGWQAEGLKHPFDRDFVLPYRSVGIPAPETDRPMPEVVIDDGHPDVRLSPIDELLKTYRAYTARRSGIRNAHVGTDQGTVKLREAMAGYLSETRGIDCSPTNVLITHGAQMSIYLVARLLLGPGTRLVVAKPNYPVANRTFTETGATLVEVPADGDGMDMEALEAVCKREPITAVYVIPHHHYPTTVTLSVARRMKLLELAQRHAFAVIEDDYDYEYHYTLAPYLPLASGGHAGNILYIGSFSKILDPSLRIGFLVAPRNLIQQAVALRRLIDVGGDGYMQNALAALMEDGELKRHLKKARRVYHERRDVLDGLLKRELGDAVSYLVPSGGMAFWLRLLPDYPVDRLLESRMLHVLGLDAEQRAFRFGFASMDEGELEQTVSVLKRALG